MSEGAAGGPHRFEVRVYYEDTDAGGVVYHASYLRFAERARTELLRALGFDHRGLRARFGGLLAVRRLAIDYRAPARLDDRLEVETEPVRTSGARLALVQTIRRGPDTLARLEVEIVFLGTDGRPSRLPAPLRAALAEAAAPSAGLPGCSPRA
ncbi:MAG: tol-pal system-associated acyl-CoA thioesterase [Geminicoccaceae bacterium]|nr:tol-pal system-associated acyl-CoA thioesterase [Geminicoccaceae bacterium]MCX8102041.1 tol-pal system-associated acyl-CoA thioesterase [Geminicoccaceae bacterium]